LGLRAAAAILLGLQLRNELAPRRLSQLSRGGELEWQYERDAHLISRRGRGLRRPLSDGLLCGDVGLCAADPSWVPGPEPLAGSAARSGGPDPGVAPLSVSRRPAAQGAHRAHVERAA